MTKQKAAAPRSLHWRRTQPGEYVAADHLGNTWRISQAVKSRWEVLCNGDLKDHAEELWVAKYYAAVEFRRLELADDEPEYDPPRIVCCPSAMVTGGVHHAPNCPRS